MKGKFKVSQSIEVQRWCSRGEEQRREMTNPKDPTPRAPSSHLWSCLSHIRQSPFCLHSISLRLRISSYLRKKNFYADASFSPGNLPLISGFCFRLNASLEPSIESGTCLYRARLPCTFHIYCEFVCGTPQRHRELLGTITSQFDATQDETPPPKGQIIIRK